MKTDTKTVVWTTSAEKSEDKDADKGAEKSGMSAELEDWKVPPCSSREGGTFQSSNSAAMPLLSAPLSSLFSALVVHTTVFVSVFMLSRRSLSSFGPR